MTVRIIIKEVMKMVKALSPRRIIKDENGQNTVEFALIMPILLIIVFGIIDFGWLFFNMALVSNTTRSGARYAIVNIDNAGDVATLQSMVDTKIKDGLPKYLKQTSAGLTVTVAENKTAASPYDDVIDVRVKVKIPLFTPVISTMTGHQYYEMDKTVTMRAES